MRRQYTSAVIHILFSSQSLEIRSSIYYVRVFVVPKIVSMVLLVCYPFANDDNICISPDASADGPARKTGSVSFIFMLSLYYFPFAYMFQVVALLNQDK